MWQHLLSLLASWWERRGKPERQPARPWRGNRESGFHRESEGDPYATLGSAAFARHKVG